MTNYYPMKITEAFPALTGTPGITQGVYGDRGNLELVCPDPADGFWVFWFNADPVDQKQGAAQNQWSGGLHITTATVVSAVSIEQASYGPDFLEAVVVENGRSNVLVWSPERGFVRSNPQPKEIPQPHSVITSHDGAFSVERTSGGVVQIKELTKRGQWMLLEPDLGNADAVTACWSSLDGGTLEIVCRSGTQLRHERWNTTRHTLTGTKSPVRSNAWVHEPTRTLQRTVPLG